MTSVMRMCGDEWYALGEIIVGQGGGGSEERARECRRNSANLSVSGVRMAAASCGGLRACAPYGTRAWRVWRCLGEAGLSLPHITECSRARIAPIASGSLDALLESRKILHATDMRKV